MKALKSDFNGFDCLMGGKIELKKKFVKQFWVEMKVKIYWADM